MARLRELTGRPRASAPGFTWFSPKSDPGPALPWPRQKRRRGWRRRSSSRWCRRAGRRQPRRGPRGSRSRRVPSCPAPVAPGPPRCSPPRCPTEVRGVRGGLQRGREGDGGAGMLRRRFAHRGAGRRGGMGGVWGGFSPNPRSPPGTDPAPGTGSVCSPSPGAYRRCLPAPAGTAFAFGAGRRAPLQGCRGVLAMGRYRTLLPPLKPTMSWLAPQKRPQRPPCPRPRRSSSSLKRPSPCLRRRWVQHCSSWTWRHLPPSR